MADSVTSIDTVAEDPSELRAALIDQLQYLADEVEALKKMINLVPEAIRGGRPMPGDLSVKEVYGCIAISDERVYHPRLKRMTDPLTGAPAFDPIDEEELAEAEDWNAQPIHDIFERVQAARHQLVAAFKALDPEAWRQTGRFAGEQRDVYALAHHITQEDTRRLRIVSHRLYESNLSGDRGDQPK